MGKDVRESCETHICSFADDTIGESWLGVALMEEYWYPEEKCRYRYRERDISSLAKEDVDMFVPEMST